MTGGAGFIGSHIATHLSENGHEVRIFDNLSGHGSSERAATLVSLPGIQLLTGDIRDIEGCHKISRGADFVLHHAAEPSVTRSVDDPAACAEINVAGTINMLVAAHAAKSVKRFVFASSCAVYGDTPADPKLETSPTDPLTPYATTKLAGEYFCQNFFRLHGLPTVVLRYFNVYGPGQDPNGAYAAVIPKFVTALVTGNRPVIYGDGEQSRDFVFVKDVVRANLRAIISNSEVAGHTFNIGGGGHTSLNVLLKKLERILGMEIIPDKRDPRAGDIKYSHADVSAAAKLLDFRPCVTLEEGLAQTLQWYDGNCK